MRKALEWEPPFGSRRPRRVRTSAPPLPRASARPRPPPSPRRRTPPPGPRPPRRRPDWAARREPCACPRPPPSPSAGAPWPRPLRRLPRNRSRLPPGNAERRDAHPAPPRPAGCAHRQSTSEVAPPPRLYCRRDESRRRLRPARPALRSAGPGRSRHAGGDPRAQEMISVSCRASAGGSVVPQGPGKWNLEGSSRFRAGAGTSASRCFTRRVWQGDGNEGEKRGLGLVEHRDRLQPHPLNNTVCVFSENSTMEEECSFLTY